MAQAPDYNRSTEFAEDERDNVGGRSTVRTAALDSELDAVSTSINALQSNQELNQRDDGEIRDGRVKLFTLAADVLALLVSYGATPRGAWQTATAYNLKDLVTESGQTYICAVAHTSGVFATDLVAFKWLLFSLGSNPAASGIPFTPTATIAATNVQAAINESDTENRALSAAAQATANAAVPLTQLANTSSASQGAGLVGFSWTLNYASGTAGWALATARWSILKYIPVAEWAAIFAYTSTYDATANIATCLANEKLITMPPGQIRGEWNMAAIRGRTIIGAGRDVVAGTVLENVGNAALFTLNNTSGDCKNNHFSRFVVRNRDTATYTTFDAFLVSGNDTNENGHCTFTEVDAVGARYFWNITSRFIWSAWYSCHGSAMLSDVWHFDTSQNCAELTWVDCRGAGGGRGMSLNKTSGDPFFSFKLIGVNLEKNALQGLYITGVGIAGLSIVGGHYEENTTTMGAGDTKVNILCDASQLTGFNILGSAQLGTPLATPLNHAIRITSATCSGQIDACRPGVFSSTFAHVANGIVIVGPQDGGTTTISGDGAYTMGREQSGSFTGTLTGFASGQNVPCSYVLQGRQVTLSFTTAVEATSTTTAMTMTGILASLRPTTVQTVQCLIKDNGTVVHGLAQIDSAGVITFQNGIGGGAFTGSGTKGVRAQNLVAYIRD